MAEKLRKYLESYKKCLVDEAEAELTNILVLNKLVELFPMTHKVVDKTHLVWARALRDVMWLGWLSEAKYRKGMFDDRIYNSIRQSIIDAFEIGRKYVDERP